MSEKGKDSIIRLMIPIQCEINKNLWKINDYINKAINEKKRKGLK